MATSRGLEVVRRYAMTLLEAAQEAGVEVQVRRDLDGLVATLDASSELSEFLENRLVTGEAAASALQQVFEGKVQGLTLNFLLLVGRRRRAYLLAEILRTVVAILDERAGIDTAQVRSAMALSGDQVEQLRQRLEAYTGRQLQLETEVDESLRGGAIATIGDIVLDGSVDTQLTRLRQRFLAGTGS